MRGRRREITVFSMSFLDAITAGFGCVVPLVQRRVHELHGPRC